MIRDDTPRLELEEKELVLEFFRPKRDGFFVEVGVNDPKVGSQTWLLEQNGWHGILIEPQSRFYSRLVSERRNSIVYGAACGPPGQKGTATLHLASEPGFATLQPQQNSHGIEFIGTETVPLTTLDEILEQHGNPSIDFVSLDVESDELDVLRGFSLVKRTVLSNWYVPKGTRFTMATARERLELFRKMYLATPLRQWRLARRRLQKLQREGSGKQ